MKSERMTKNNTSGRISSLVLPTDGKIKRLYVEGTITGALGAVSSNPFDLVKTRMQAGLGLVIHVILQSKRGSIDDTRYSPV